MILWKQTNLDIQCLLLGAACWSWAELRVSGTCSNLCLRGADWVSPSYIFVLIWLMMVVACMMMYNPVFFGIQCYVLTAHMIAGVLCSLRDNTSGSTAMQLLYNHQHQKSCTHHPLVLVVSTVRMYISSVKWLLATWSGWPTPEILIHASVVQDLMMLLLGMPPTGIVVLAFCDIVMKEFRSWTTCSQFLLSRKIVSNHFRLGERQRFQVAYQSIRKQSVFSSHK